MLPPMMSMQQSVGSISPPDVPADAPSSSLSANNLLFSGGGGSGGGPLPFDSKDSTETTPQFKPRSHYAQPYYQSTSGGQQQQQQPSMSLSGGGGNVQNPMGQSYPRNSLTPETRQNSMGDHLHHPSHQQQQIGYNQSNAAGAQPPPPPPPSRMSNNVANNNIINSNNNININDNQYPGASNMQGPMYGGGGGPRRSFGQNGIGGGPPGARQSLIDRSSTSHAAYVRQDDSGNGPQPHRDSRVYRQNQYDSGGGGSMDDESADPSLPRRNTKYVNRESLYSFQQVTLHCD